MALTVAPAATKQCSKCGETKPATEFYQLRKDKTLQAYCIPCGKANVRAWLNANPGAARKHKHDAYLRNPAVPILNSIRVRSKRDGIPCDLTVDYLRRLLAATRFCPVLGIPLEHKVNGKRDGPRDNSPSVDRFEPARGYVVGNVFVISHRANRLKSDATRQELQKVLDWMDHTHAALAHERDEEDEF